MAVQLARSQSPPFSLVIIDTPPTYDRDFSISSILRSSPEFVRNVPGWIREDLLNSSFPKLARRAERKLQRLIKRVGHALSKESKASLNLKPEDFGEIAHLAPLAQELFRLHWKATDEHRPQFYPGRVTLFRAQTRPLFRYLSRDLGWSKFASEVEVISVPGHHNTLVIDRYARPLAEALQTWLDSSEKPAVVS